MRQGSKTMPQSTFCFAQAFSLTGQFGNPTMFGHSPRMKSFLFDDFNHGNGVAPSNSLSYKGRVKYQFLILLLVLGAMAGLAQSPPPQQRRAPTLAEVERMY